MKLTVGIPNYNGGELLKKTILSTKKLILHVNDYEILIVDNCSTDNSENIVDELINDFPNIRFIVNSENVGRIGNRNKVLDLALGERILFLMTGDELLDFNYNEYFTELNKNEVLVFGIQIGKNISTHWAQKYNEFIDTKEVLNQTILTIGHNYGLTPLQTHFISKNIITKYNLRFDEEFEFLADLKFLNKYISYFDKVKFFDLGIVKWWDGKNKTTFKKQLVMYKDFIRYFPLVYEKYTNKKINIFLFKTYIVNQIFFIFLNNKRVGINGFSFSDILSFVKIEIGNNYYIFTLIFFPFYFLYLYINVKNNFKFPIYFNYN